MSLGQKIIVTAGAFVITFITICMVFKEDISFLLTARSVERKYGQITENSYFIEDYFTYIKEFEKTEISSKEDFLYSIYYLINSGVNYSERYCAKDYDACHEDMEKVLADDNTLSILNNYVHPYNSFEYIKYPESFDNKIWLKINRVYSNEDIAILNTKVDSIISSVITEDMTTRDKIKAIHNYIIDNATYDTAFDPESKTNAHRADTAYGVLVEGYGICSGYSDAMKLFLDKLNVVNYKVSNDKHIWNLVLLNEEWLHLDLTWDDPISDKNITRDNYFLIDSKTLELLGDELHYYDKNLFPEA